MNSNKDNISFETAKMLKDCGIESRNSFVLVGEKKAQIIDSKNDDLEWIKNDFIPAYSWQEILWEYPDKFFGIVSKYNDSLSQFDNMFEIEKRTKNILWLLQQKKYNEADLYFRENTILLYNKK